MKKSIIGLLLIILLFFGCTLGPSTSCGTDMKCIEEAVKTCDNATGFQEIKNNPPIEEARIDIEVRRISDSNCLVTQTLSKFDVQEDAVIEDLESSSSIYPFSDNYKTFLENFASFYFSRFNSLIQENIPLTISCHARIVDGNTVMSDFEACARDQQNEMDSIFGENMAVLVSEIKSEIEEEESNLKGISLKLGEINKVEYEKSAEKTDFYSKGVSYARAFSPESVQTEISELTFNNFNLDYAISGLEKGSFVLMQGIISLDNSNEAGEFYQEAYTQFMSAQSSEKIAENFHGQNSNFVKVQADPELESYRLIYQEGNIVVLLDLTPNDINLLNVVEELELISNTLNARLNSRTEPISLNCTVSSTFEEVCRTVNEEEEYEEEECSIRHYKYQATQPTGAYSEGFFGQGCYTLVETTISNQEDVEGAFTFQVTFFDEQGTTITNLQDSEMIYPNSSQKLSVNYSYDCTNPRPQNYTHTLQAPTTEFCEMVTKTKEVPKEVCGEEEIQELSCT